MQYLFTQNKLSYAYPKSARLLKKSDFDSLKKGRSRTRISFEWGSIFYRRHDETKGRLGIIISGKSMNAVRRNRMKRVLRNEFRLLGIKKVDVLVAIYQRMKPPHDGEQFVHEVRGKLLSLAKGSSWKDRVK